MGRSGCAMLPLVIVVGCYAPNAIVGAPCGPDLECPSGQRCDALAPGGPVCTIGNGSSQDGPLDAATGCVTWDPDVKGERIELSTSNLDASTPSSPTIAIASRGLSSATGQRAYFEILVIASDDNSEVGIKDDEVGNLDGFHPDISGANVFYDNFSDELGAKGTWDVAIGRAQPNFDAGDIVMWALDRETGQIWQGRNGVWLGNGDPATAANPTFTATPAQAWFASVCPTDGATFRILASSRDFQHAPPAGFPSLGAAVGLGDAACAP